MSSSKIMQIVGLSNSGKTKLILDLINFLEKLNISVATIKSAKNNKYDYSNKDSERFLINGAIGSSVSFSNVTQIYTKIDVSLSDLINTLQSLVNPDIIIIEGYKKEAYDKILVWSDELEDNLDLFNLSNLKLVYCQKEQYKQHIQELTELEEKLSTKVVSAVDQLTSLFTE
ncbi:MAG: molybdopterin-guanine dinucleotide biosynthesis protein B [Candidatus Heimdallarchaeota archaeon]|nr:molybdopterin-guanine dinucleotide biosynthesis protein B [Candidatus Heimdallarchaeota archaeon]